MPSHFHRQALLMSLFSLAIPFAASAAPDPHVEGEVLVTFKSGTSSGSVEESLRRSQGKESQRTRAGTGKKRRTTHLLRQGNRSSAELIQALLADPSVESAEPNYLRRISVAVPDPTEMSQLWGLTNEGQTLNSASGTRGMDIRFAPAWKLARKVSGDVVIAVIDTGMDLSHPDLQANLWLNDQEIPDNGLDDDRNGYVDDLHGYDFARNSASLTDSGSHGTHVAGTIAAEGRNGMGISGVHPGAKILPLKVSQDGETMSTSAILAAMQYVVQLRERGVNVVAVNASYGGSTSTNAERLAIESLHGAGILLCAAAGNDGVNNDTTASYPANYPIENILSIAAISQTGALAPFSNFGAATVHLAAPGVNIYSTVPSRAMVTASLTVDGNSYPAKALEFAAPTSPGGIRGKLISCGIGRSSEFPATVRGNPALIQRGILTFAEKARAAAQAGATAVVVYDNIESPWQDSAWTLGTSDSWLPVLQISKATGETLLSRIGTAPSSATLTLSSAPGNSYGYLDGTSMAAPHVAGAIAFAALNFPDDTALQRRQRILSGVTPLPSLKGKTGTGGLLNLLAVVDSDSNGLPDYWQTQLASTSPAPASGFPGASDDSDQDGFDNLTEFFAATHPADPLSRPGLVLAGEEEGTSREPGPFSLSFDTSPALLYQIESSSSLAHGPWLPLGDPVAGDGNRQTVQDPGAFPHSASRFYRLRLILP